MDIPANHALWIDRLEATDVLYRYASTIDVKDYESLRQVFTDDAVGTYGTRRIEGADNIVGWIAEQGTDKGWQHHLISVYHVDIDGDVANALTYHTSHQTTLETPDTVKQIVARYHDRLVRTVAGWKIADKRMEVLWRETRTVPQP